MEFILSHLFRTRGIIFLLSRRYFYVFHLQIIKFLDEKRYMIHIQYNKNKNKTEKDWYGIGSWCVYDEEKNRKENK